MSNLYRTTSWGLALLMLFVSTGCGPKTEGDTTIVARAKSLASNAWTATRDTTTGAWSVVSEKSSQAWTVVCDKASSGGEAAWDASKSAMLWSKDQSLNGWDWIKTNVTSATEWTADASNNLWMVTRQQSGEFFLWVKVEAEGGVAYVRTAIPEAWKVTKDAAGDTWVWVNEHRVQAATAAAIVSLVVAGMIVNPAVTATLVARGAITRVGAEFLSTMYHNNKDSLGGLSEEKFVAVGTEVLQQNAENVTAAGAAANSETAETPPS